MLLFQRFWNDFEWILVPFWNQFSSFLRVMWWILLRCTFLCLFWCYLETHLIDLGAKLGPKMEPKITKKLWKYGSKNCHKNHRLWNATFLELGSILGAFLEVSGPQNLAFRPIHPSKYWKSCVVTSDLEKVSSGRDLGRIFAPSWVQNGPKIVTKGSWKTQ